jgi:uncharacterized OB-fold protein
MGTAEQAIISRIQENDMAGFRCPRCGKVAMVQKVCCGRPMKRA